MISHGPGSQGFSRAVEDFGSHPYSYRGRAVKPARVSTRGSIPEDAVTSHAVDFVASPGAEPFFLMVSHFFVHTPVETECDWMLQQYDSRIPRDATNREQRVKYGAFVETLDHHVSVLRDPGVAVDRELHWHFPYYHPERGYGESLDVIGVDDFAVSKTRPQSAIRRGRHKLLMFYEGQPAELYDLVEDPRELRDLSRLRPDLANRLALALREYLDRVGARIPTH